MKPACTAALMPLRIAITSAIKIDNVHKLKADAWMNFPSQLRMMKPFTVPCDDFDPSKFILMDPLVASSMLSSMSTSG